MLKVLAIFLLTFPFCLNAQSDFDPDIDLSELVGNKKNIGITAGYSVNGETNWSNSLGFLCGDDEIPFTSKTKTRIASIAKNFTSVAIMQLVEKNMIALESPIGVYLKDLPEDKKQITILQLMAHTSGVPQYQNKKEVENSEHYSSLKEAENVFIQRPLLFKPGTKYFYTTHGYVILGRLIESVSGFDYGEYMKRNIFDVADMKNTAIEEMGITYENKSCLYHNSGKKTKQMKQNDLSNRIPGGGFYSNLEDLLKFGNALLEGKLITSKSLNKLFESQPVAYDGNKYGLGWTLYGPAPNENLVVGHSGGQTGCTSQLMIVPKSKTVVVVLSNTSGTYPKIATFASNLISFSERKIKSKK